MNNLSAIHHVNFDLLHELTNNYNKATLLDKLIYWWQISKFTLDDQKIWFTRSLDQIANDSKLAKRSVERYLHDFEQAGLIEKTNKLFKKKNLYIRITDKLLSFLKRSHSNSLTKFLNKDGQGSNLKSNNESLFLTQNGGTDHAKMAESIYKDKDYKLNNSIINQQDNVINFDSSLNLPNKKSNKLSKPIYSIEPQISNYLDERLKNYIKGMLTNVQQQYNLKFSDPNKLFAEVVFSVSQDAQWQDVQHPHHRINIIAKLLRQQQWRTPKGFYNHWDIGQLFHQKERLQFEKIQIEKTKETQLANQLFSNNSVTKTQRIQQAQTNEPILLKANPYEKKGEMLKAKQFLQEINLNIHSEKSYLKQLESWFEQKNTSITQSLIDSVINKLARLNNEKHKIMSVLEENDSDYKSNSAIFDKKVQLSDSSLE